MKHVDLIVKYLAKLQGQNDISLVLGGDQGVKMIGTVDTSYAPDGENYESITGATLHMAFHSHLYGQLTIYELRSRRQRCFGEI